MGPNEQFAKLADAYEDSLAATTPRRAKRYERQEPVVPRCKACGLRKRRPGHDDGEDHKRHAKTTAA